MTRDDITFLLELLMSNSERAFFDALRSTQGQENRDVRQQYSDYLNEQGRTKSADLINRGWTPATQTVLDEPLPGFAGLRSTSITSGYVQSGYGPLTALSRLPVRSGGGG